MADQQILCGFIMGAHGLNGYLKVECLSDNPARFAPGARLTMEQTARPPQVVEVESASRHKERLLVKLAGIETKEAAEKLRGAKLLGQADAEALAGLPAGVYYHYQLQGLNVWQGERELGEITEILARPANDVYVMRTLAGQEVLIPALKSVVTAIDLTRNRMEVNLPEGLLDE